MYSPNTNVEGNEDSDHVEATYNGGVIGHFGVDVSVYSISTALTH